MARRSGRRFVVAVTIAVSAALPGARPAAQAPANASASRLRDLATVDQLRTAFDADAGKVRVLLLMSPT